MMDPMACIWHHLDVRLREMFFDEHPVFSEVVLRKFSANEQSRTVVCVIIMRFKTYDLIFRKMFQRRQMYTPGQSVMMPYEIRHHELSDASVLNF